MKTLDECVLHAIGYRPTRLTHQHYEKAMAHHRHFGVTDEALEGHIRNAFGRTYHSGFTSPDGYVYAVKATGKTVRFWYGVVAAHGKPTLAGAALVKKVRELLNLPYPTGVAEKATKVRKDKLQRVLDRVAELRKRLARKMGRRSA